MACWCRRSGGGQRADAGERCEVVTLPGPASGEMKRPGSAVAGQSPGDRDQPATHRAGGTDGAVREADQLGPAEQVVRERAKHRPGAIGVELSRWEVHKRLIL